MSKLIPFDVVRQIELPAIAVDDKLTDGDPLEINKELYFVCEVDLKHNSEHPLIGVIPLVVRNPSKVENIQKYIKCLSIAHRKVQFKNKQGDCGIEVCDEMIIS